MEKRILAFDIGGTKIAAAVVTQSGEKLFTMQEPTSQNGVEEGFSLIASMVRSCMEAQSLTRDDVLGIGISLAAVLEKDTDFILWAPNIEGWRNVDLRAYLEKEFDLPVFLEYDGHAAVLGEAWQGAGKGCDSVVDIIIGTGVGAGAIIDGKLLRGKTRLAGAIGWQMLSLTPETEDPNSERIGFWENLTAGTGIGKYARRVLSAEEQTEIAGENQLLTSKELFIAAQNGNASAMKVCDQVAEWIGYGASNVISILNPEVIILGGNVGHACGFLLEKISASAKKWAQPFSAADARFVISEMGTDAGILGAAYAVILRKEESLRRKNLKGE